MIIAQENGKNITLKFISNILEIVHNKVYMEKQGCYNHNPKGGYCMSETAKKIKQSILSMIENISGEEDLRRIHNFIQRIYLKK